MTGRLRKIASIIMLLCGGLLIYLSLHVEKFWNEGSVQYYNVREAGLVYGILLLVLGIVLIIVKHLSFTSFLWCVWAGLAAVQLIRFLPAMPLVSHLMNSIMMFWGVVYSGIVLIVISILRRMWRIF